LLSLGNTPFNPLDVLKVDRINLCDDVATLAEAIVPATSGSNEAHFSDKARSYVSGLILHLMTAAPETERHLGTLWQWLRLDHEKWIELLADMMLNDDPVAGEIVKATANEIASLMKTSEREYGSIISTAQKYTDVFKSPALRESLKTSPKFSAADLTNGNTIVYLIVPADRLKSHSTYMRLVITSLLRSVIRNPGKDVLFLIDEAYAMGYHSEIELALGAYAGFGVHLWTIWQSLVQIQDLYPKTWQSFISNCSVRHFFNISDNFSADYISSMFGQTSVPEYNDKGEVSGASARPLVTPDEIRRQSDESIYTVIDQLAPTEIPKAPYYKMGLEYDPNPYYKPEMHS
jgi:type IV secretion system protein VirD4